MLTIALQARVPGVGHGPVSVSPDGGSVSGVGRASWGLCSSLVLCTFSLLLFAELENSKQSAGPGPRVQPRLWPCEIGSEEGILVPSLWGRGSCALFTLVTHRTAVWAHVCHFCGSLLCRPRSVARQAAGPCLSGVYAFLAFCGMGTKSLTLRMPTDGNFFWVAL